MRSLFTLHPWAVLTCLLLSFGLAAQDVTIDASATPLNRHADQLGIWVNSNADVYRPEYVRKLRDDLKIKSIRHGWQYSVMDPQNPDRFLASPCDSKVSPYIVNNCEVVESMPLSQIAELRDDLGAKGYLIIGTDGINYTGSEDAKLAAMTKAEREQFYLDNARRMAEWGRDNGFRYFEIGNENDLPGEMVDFGRGTEWTGRQYGAYAIRMAKVIEEVYPEAKIGINGGWGSSIELRRAWWDDILAAAPNINTYIDFIVIHKYEFGLPYGTWRDNLWSFGQVHPDVRASVANNFPGKPIHVTETSGFYNEGVGHTPAYRGMVNVEMLGNMLTSPEITHVQHWGTRWSNFLVFERESDDYANMGIAQRAYTEFMKPHMIANGTAGAVRYFAATDPADGSLTVWFVNHAETASTLEVDLANFNGKAYDQWELKIADGNPYSKDLTLTKVDQRQLANSGIMSVTVPATGVTVAAFGAADKQPTPPAPPAPAPPTPPTTDPTNVALNKPAKQTSTLGDFGADRAVDGNTDGNFQAGSVTHTLCGTNDWWQVDLQGSYAISEIKIFNRTDFGPERLKNYDVIIFDNDGSKVWTNYQQNTAGTPTVLNVDEVIGRYVRVRLRKGGGPCLSLAEVQVFGVDAAGKETTSTRNQDALPVEIYPNPTSGSLQVNLPGRFSVELLDVHGRSLLRQEQLSDRSTLSLDAYPDGVYQLRLRTAGGKVATRKVVLQR